MGFLYRLKMKYQEFMVGRYGVDEFNIFLLILAVVLLGISRLFSLLIPYLISWIVLIYCCFRMYSRNISGRYEEKQKFLKVKNRFFSWYNIKKDAWHNRKTHRYFRCKSCKASIRIPKGVGKVEVSCPRCRNKMIKKA